MTLSLIESLLKHEGIDQQFIKSRWVELSKKMWFEEAGQKLPGPFQVLLLFSYPHLLLPLSSPPLPLCR